MLRGAAIFLVVTVIAAILGFGGIAAGVADVARILCYVFLVVTVVLFILGLLKQ